MTMAVLDRETMKPKIRASLNSMPKYADMRVIATIVAQTWTIPPMITARHERRSFWNENSRPIVKRSSTIPILPKVSMAFWLVMSPNPYGPTRMPMIRKSDNAWNVEALANIQEGDGEGQNTYTGKQQIHAESSGEGEPI